MAEIKRVTLHPLKSDGSIDTAVNLYPKTLTTGIVDEEGNEFDPQIKLVSGQTIKTVNGEDILGEGNIEIDAGSVHWGKVLGDINDQADLTEKLSGIEEDISDLQTSKQDVLVSGTNIKTINNESILGSGNIDVQAGGGANLTPLEVENDNLNLLEFINTAENPETYTISNENDVHVYILKENTSEDLYVQKGCIISVYPYSSATILAADGQYVYFVSGDYLTGGVAVNYDDVEYLIDDKIAQGTVTISTDQTITGAKKFESSTGTTFSVGGVYVRFLDSSPAFRVIPDNNGNFNFWYNTTKLAQLNSNSTFLYRTLLPSSNTIDLGSSQYPWNAIYATTLKNGNIEKPVNRIVTDDNSILPMTGGILTLGNQSYRWNALYLGSTINFNPQQITKIENLKTLSVNTINLGNQVGTSTTWSDTKFLQYDNANVKYVGKLYAGLDVNNQPIRNIPDTPDEGTSPINKNYADTNLQGKLTAGTGIAITNNVISSTLDGIDYEVVQSLPSTGVKGTIYLVPNGSSEQQNIYDEYIWLPPQQEGESGRFELIGTTQAVIDNMVTTDTAQTISGEKTISNAVSLKFAGTYTAQIVNQENQLRIKYGGSDKLKISTANITSSAHLLPNSANTYDLGTSTYKWRNLYLAGAFKSGTGVYGLTLPDTTSFTANKTIATTDDLSNYVDLTSAQEISGAKTFTTTVLLKNNVGIKYGNSYSNGFTICNDGSGGLLFKNNYNVTKYHFSDSYFYPDVSGAGSLGSSSKAWGDLYLTGNLSDGTNAVSVAHLAQNTPTQWYGTQAEYDALGTYDSNTIYNILES